MDNEEHTEYVVTVMKDFARLTGLEPVSPHPVRYLWTDAFAVCNFLELYHRTGERAYLDLALRLVDQVHHVLGRHREDDSRNGWISGLDQGEGEKHPTAGGLRIGKILNERKANEPRDDNLEWEQDGQYFHYLTKWMHALNRVGQVASDPKYSIWAIELAKRADSAFTYMPPGRTRKRMYWKMSIDLSHPLVSSMGQHDALDGLVTFNELKLGSMNLGREEGLDLSMEIEDISKIVSLDDLPTNDTLGMGGLITDSARVAQIEKAGVVVREGLLEALIDASLVSVESFSQSGSLVSSPESRLAFRELGLSIGLKGIPLIRTFLTNSTSRRRSNELLRKLNDLERFNTFGLSIDEFWTSPRNQEASTWSEHREINMVMLATSLAPDSFLSI
jgi:hypothetical protein